MGNYQVKSVLVCDDIRKEVNGKDILIGVYADSIIFPNFPARLRQLCLRIVVQTDQAKFDQVNISVISEKGGTLMQMSHSLDVVPNEGSATVNVPMQNVSFPEPAAYKILFGLDEPAKEIGDFEVRLPKTSLEQRRLKDSA